MVMPVRTKADNAASRGVYPYPATVAVSELFFQHVNSTDAEPGLGVLLKLDLRAGGCGDPRAGWRRTGRSPLVRSRPAR